MKKTFAKRNFAKIKGPEGPVFEKRLFAKRVVALPLQKGMSGKGGPRHFSKPWVDPDVLLSVFEEHKSLVKNLGAYEHISRQCAPSPEGILQCHDLVKGLLQSSETAELHPNPVRTALVQLLASDPSLNNKGNFRGEVWASNKQTRICCLLSHVRKLAGEDNLTSAAAKLTSKQFMTLQILLDLVQAKEPAADAGLGKGPKGPTLEKKESSLALVSFEKRKAAEEAASSSIKKLKKNDSDVSTDSKGFPTMFASSNEASPCKAAHPLEKGADGPGPARPEGYTLSRGDRKRRESLKKKEEALEKEKTSQGNASLEKVPSESLHGALGYSKKRPAAALEKAKGKAQSKAKALKKAPSEQPQKTKWVKLRKTTGTNPERCYITGSTEIGGKLKLIVEVSHKRTPHYKAIADTLMARIEEQQLSKEQALELRDELCEAKG